MRHNVIRVRVVRASQINSNNFEPRRLGNPKLLKDLQRKIAFIPHISLTSTHHLQINLNLTLQRPDLQPNGMLYCFLLRVLMVQVVIAVFKFVRSFRTTNIAWKQEFWLWYKVF